MTATPGVADDGNPVNSNMLLRPITLTRPQRITAAAVCTLSSILYQIPSRDGWFFALALLVGFTSLFVVMRVPEHLGTTTRRGRLWVPLLLLFAF